MTRDRILGMFLGIAIGDALGMPAENIAIDEKSRKYGRITSYVRPDGHKWFDGREAGTWTDDTQLTLLVADSLMEHRRINMDDLARRHVEYWQREGDLGFGPTTRTALKKLRDGVHWSKSGISENPKHGVGNGMPMKIAPLGALRASRLWDRKGMDYRSAFAQGIVNFTLMTHRRLLGIESAMAHVYAIRYCLRQSRTEPLRKDEFMAEVLKMSEFASFKRHLFTSDDSLPARFEVMAKLDPDSLTDEQIIKLFGGGTGYVYNSLPFSYAFFLRNPYSLETLYDVVNSGGDTDTNASIVGGMLGALNGASIFPEHLTGNLWQVERIRTTADKFFDIFFGKEGA